MANLHSLGLTRNILLAVTTCLLSSTEAMALIAESNTQYFWSGTTSKTETGIYIPGGAWELGQNTATCGASDTSGPLGSQYAGSRFARITATKTSGSCRAEANSEITVAPPAPSGANSYTIGLRAFSDRNAFSGDPSANAVAQGKDPQFIDRPGVFGSEFGLSAGSFLFEEDPDGLTEAGASYALGGPDLSRPIAQIDLAFVAAEGGSIDASVFFNSDPRLTFFDPDTLSPITASDVENILESADGLNSPSGLASALSLFAYQFDLSSTVLPDDAAFSSSGQAFASVAVPEPSSVLSLLALGTGSAFLRKRQSKSEEN